MIDKIREYAQAFDLSSLYAVKQFLAKFGWNRDAEMAMTGFLEQVEDERRQHAESLAAQTSAFQERKRKAAGMEKNEVDPGRPKVVIGFCPRCGSNMVGEPVRECADKKRVKRHFYKECTSCSYYAEIWKRKNKYNETEGG